MAKNCDIHPKYKVVLPPRSFCSPCWAMYLKKFGQDKTLKAYYKFVGKISQKNEANSKKVQEVEKIME